MMARAVILDREEYYDDVNWDWNMLLEKDGKKYQYVAAGCVIDDKEQEAYLEYIYKLKDEKEYYDEYHDYGHCSDFAYIPLENIEEYITPYIKKAEKSQGKVFCIYDEEKGVNNR